MSTREELETELEEVNAKLAEAREKGPSASFGPVNMDWTSWMRELREQRREIREELRQIPYEKTSVVDFPQE